VLLEHQRYEFAIRAQFTELERELLDGAAFGRHAALRGPLVLRFEQPEQGGQVTVFEGAHGHGAMLP
jgi:hypothetical protein